MMNKNLCSLRAPSRIELKMIANTLSNGVESMVLKIEFNSYRFAIQFTFCSDQSGQFISLLQNLHINSDILKYIRLHLRLCNSDNVRCGLFKCRNSLHSLSCQIQNLHIYFLFIVSFDTIHTCYQHL